MTDRFRLDGKIALVTGASGGLGEHFAHVLGRAGASVVVAGRRQAPLQKLAHDLGAAGIDARAIAIDVTDESSIKAGFDKAQAHFGDRKSVVKGKSVSVRVDLGGRRISKKKHKQRSNTN